MKKFWEISATTVTKVLIGWLLATNVLVWLVHTTGWWPCKVLLFVCIACLPGAALLRALRIVLRSFSVGLLYSFGISLLVLMLSGLAANQILYIFGVDRPLDLAGVLGAWNVVTCAIVAMSICMNSQPLRFTKWPANGLSRCAWFLAGASLLLPGMAVMGAFRLNNGGNEIFAELTICYAAALIVYAFILRRRLPGDLLVWFVFVVGLTILLMTSLRGWDIVGHDIEREFRAYNLTHLYGRWDIGLDRDPYNACLSITILPEVFAKLLDISGLIVFKVVLQIIFAACPAVIFVLLRRYVFKLGALVGSLIFICYPTFITDSAMLTRQGIAYLFFSLALIVISNKAQLKRYKLLFILCALGAILSHYSTAYMFVALFMVAAGCKWYVSLWRRRHAPKNTVRPQPTVLSPLFAALLFLMTFTWYTQLTATSQGLATTLRASFSNITSLFSADNKSSDTSAALLFAGGRTQADLYQSYLIGSQYPYQTKQIEAKYFPTLVSDDLPVTKLGQKMQHLGMNSSLISALRQNFAKVLQATALMGVMFVAYKLLRRRPIDLEPDFIYLNIAGIALLVMMVLLPILSINYGILRAFQQALIFMILPIMYLLMKGAYHLWPWLRTTAATVGVIFLFLLFTGLFAQLLGGSSPALSMNNSGLYHGLYYSPQVDAQSFRWIEANIPAGSDVRAANFNRALMHNPTYPFSKPGILPSQLGASSYIYLDQAQIQKQRLYIYHQSSPLIMTFPLEYYTQERDQIYSTMQTGVYR